MPSSSPESPPEESPPETEPLLDFHPETDAFRDAVVEGLTSEPKQVPSKFLYDERGSKLFDRICTLDEYYPTRTEMRIMREHVGAMAERIGPKALLVELGSGSSKKVRVLLDHLDAPVGYVPVDISREHLLKAAQRLAADYPDVPVYPVCADYTGAFRLPEVDGTPEQVAAYYPGSTIGNFPREAAQSFLARVADLVGPGGGLLIGVDLQKDRDVLRAAYNDAEGVTAAFNKNLLVRINRELDADIPVEAFRHEAVWNEDARRIEMHLVSEEEQEVRLDGTTVSFASGESICTEYSNKYTLDSFAAMADSAGWRVEQVWTDPDRLFSVQYLTATAPAETSE